MGFVRHAHTRGCFSLNKLTEVRIGMTSAPDALDSQQTRGLIMIQRPNRLLCTCVFARRHGTYCLSMEVEVAVCLKRA